MLNQDHIDYQGCTSRQMANERHYTSSVAFDFFYPPQKCVVPLAMMNQYSTEATHITDRIKVVINT